MPLGVHGYTMYHCEKTKLRMADLWPTEQADTRETPYPFLSNLLTDSMERHSHGKGFVVEHLSKKMRRMCILISKPHRPSILNKLTVTTSVIGMDLVVTGSQIQRHQR